MKRWLNSAWYACKGTVLFFRTEPNGQIELVATILVLALCVWLPMQTWELCVVLLCIAALLAAEMINTSIERLANFITRDRHDDIGAVKDLAAAAVMMIAIAGGVIALLIFVPKIVEQFS
jgi:diacylglycerol kinase